MSTTPSVFISYSRDDSQWLEDFRIHLKPFLRNKADLKVWDDQQIEVGDKWKDEIDKALASATVAVLLVSPSFLASDFIANNELPPLLKAAEDRGLIIFWIPIRTSAYGQTPIAQYQAAYPPSQPIARLSPAEQDDAWVTICKRLDQALQRS